LKLGHPFLNESKENERKRVEDFNKINGMSTMCEETQYGSCKMNPMN
jgi:hypothetical protein